MKLRNKKTGEIWDIGKIITNDNPSYDTLESIVKDFEDNKQPLIKDPRILNAVRVWVEANKLVPECELRYYSSNFSLVNWQASIEFNAAIEGLENGEKYTIEELCGEEKECES